MRKREAETQRESTGVGLKKKWVDPAMMKSSRCNGEKAKKGPEEGEEMPVVYSVSCCAWCSVMFELTRTQSVSNIA
jgi:hypothetical protein